MRAQMSSEQALVAIGGTKAQHRAIVKPLPLQTDSVEQSEVCASLIVFVFFTPVLRVPCSLALGVVIIVVFLGMVEAVGELWCWLTITLTDCLIVHVYHFAASLT